MSIILNEYEWAERAINNRYLGKKPGETLSRVARYYYENQYSRKEVRKLLDQYLMQCDPDASLFHWSSTLDRIAKNAANYPLIQIDYIHISKSELDVIAKLESKRLRRVAFTLLCTAKYWNCISDRNDYWVNTSDKEIFKMANVVVSCRDQDLMYNELLRSGYIRLSKKIDNLNVRVLFGIEDDCYTDGIYVKDFRNLGYQYMKYCGEPFVECEGCGLTIKVTEKRSGKGLTKNGMQASTGRHKKYCTSCAAEIKTRQNVNAVMKRRNVVS